MGEHLLTCAALFHQIIKFPPVIPSAVERFR